MLGVNLSIQVQNALHSLGPIASHPVVAEELNTHFPLSQRSTPHMHSLPHQHLYMHQRTHRHAFTPILHQASTLLPPPHVMGAQDRNFNMHVPRRMLKPPFAPFTAFHTEAQKSFSSPKGGRWAALHVSIAWKIYYNKKLKKIQEKPNSLYGDLTPECPIRTTPPDSEPHTSDQLSCTLSNPEFPCGSSEIREVRKTTHQFPNLHRPEKPDEKEKHTAHPADEASALRDKTRNPTVAAELDVRHGGSLNRKRQPEHDDFIQTKRIKKETAEETFDSVKHFYTDPSWFSTSHAHPVQHRHTSHLSGVHPNSRCDGSSATGGLLCYPAAEIPPYQSVPWELLWNIPNREDLRSGQTVLRENPLNACKAQRQNEAFSGFFLPPLYFPPASTVQEPAYLRGREALHAQHESVHLQPCRSQLPHPGFLTTSC